MDIKNARLVKGAQGNAATEYNSTHWFVRAGSFQYGAEVDTAAIEAEKAEQDKRFGVPHDDKFKNPANSGFDADATLPNPHNFSNNPGFMATSAGSAAMSGAPDMKGGGRGGSTIGRSSSLGSRNALVSTSLLGLHR